LADANYELIKADPFHPSLHFKKIGKYRAVLNFPIFFWAALRTEDSLALSISLDI